MMARCEKKGHSSFVEAICKGGWNALKTTLTIRFDGDGLDVGGPQFETMHEVVSGLGFGRLVISADAAGDQGSGSEE